MAPNEKDVIAFWSRVRMTPTCWIWTGAVVGKNHPRGGYGGFTSGDRKNYRAHRLAYELEVGSIPKGLVLDHLCRNRLCVNPLHLEPVTVRENTLRGNSMIRKTHCRKGHRYDGVVQSRKNRSPEQYCSECADIRTKRHQEK